tara:strand:+ start:593 stop:814 length:222 start_codon:yes stop_codon:yes gene_type:complete
MIEAHTLGTAGSNNRQEFPVIMRHKNEGAMAIFMTEKDSLELTGCNAGRFSDCSYMGDWEKCSLSIIIQNEKL